MGTASTFPSQKPSSSCAICGGTGFRRVSGGVMDCDCRVLARREASRAQLPEKFRDCDLQTILPFDSVQTAALEVMRRDPRTSFFMHGVTGAGKTHLAAGQFILLSKKGVKCFWRSAAELARELQDHYCNFDNDFKPSPILSWTHPNHHVFIDDLDKISFERTEFRRESVFHFFNALSNRQCGLTITSQFDLLKLQQLERISPPISRRIDERCATLSFQPNN